MNGISMIQVKEDLQQNTIINFSIILLVLDA